LKSVSGCTSPTLEFVYNALGQQVEKLVGSSYTEYVYDAFGSVISHHSRSTWLRHIIPLGGRPLARYQDNVTYFIHGNHLGSTTFLTNHVGDSTQKLLFLPFGQRWASGGSIRDERFASLEARDSETSLDPTLFRYYHSRLYRCPARRDRPGGGGYRESSIVESVCVCRE